MGCRYKSSNTSKKCKRYIKLAHYFDKNFKKKVQFYLIFEILREPITENKSLLAGTLANKNSNILSQSKTKLHFKLKSGLKIKDEPKIQEKILDVSVIQNKTLVKNKLIIVTNYAQKEEKWNNLENKTTNDNIPSNKVGKKVTIHLNKF